MYGSLTAVVIQKAYRYRTSFDHEAGNRCMVKLAFSKVIPVVCLDSSLPMWVNPFSGNKVVYSMWPVMSTVLNLPKRLRNLFSNMLLVGYNSRKW